MTDSTKTLQQVMEEALAAQPHLRALSNLVEKEISSFVREGTMSLQEASSKLQDLSQEDMHALIRKGLEVPDVDWTYQEEETQAPGLNPLLLGQIMERLQFDGDAPELRAGPMQEGGTPAVPVDTDVVDPVALGVMLTQASDQVAEEFAQNAENLFLQVQKEWLALEEQGKEEGEVTGELVRVEKPQVLGVYERPEVDPDGYKRGQVPALRVVAKPSATALLSLSSLERQQMAQKAIATTQGRRSAIRPIAEYILQGLRSSGLCVKSAKKWKDTLPLAEHEWTFHLDGPQATQTGFSPIVVAREVMLQQLLRKLPSAERETPLYLQVVTVDEFSHRTVGWSAQLHLGCYK